MSDHPTMKAWRTHQYDVPAKALHLDDVPIPQPNPGELRVKVEATPLNLNDLERIMGGNMMVEPELPYSPGMEVLGEVEACGDGLEDWLGKRVVAMTSGAHGGFAEYAICPPVSAFEMPASLALPEAAALFFPFHLAWIGLFDRAELQAGETVLIHAAAGGSGSAAVQLALNAGATVIATAGSEEKLDLCRKLGAQHALNYRDEQFVTRVLELTDKRGVDVVFDNVGESVMAQSLHCTAYNGRYLMMGFASNKAVADEAFVVPRRIALGNIRLCGVLFAYADEATNSFLKEGMGWSFASRALGEKIHANLLKMLSDGKIQPQVGQVSSFAELPAVAQSMADRKTTGRSIVLASVGG